MLHTARPVLRRWERDHLRTAKSKIFTSGRLQKNYTELEQEHTKNGRHLCQFHKCTSKPEEMYSVPV